MITRCSYNNIDTIVRTEYGRSKMESAEETSTSRKMSARLSSSVAASPPPGAATSRSSLLAGRRCQHQCHGSGFMAGRRSRWMSAMTSKKSASTRAEFVRHPGCLAAMQDHAIPIHGRQQDAWQIDKRK